MNDSIKQLIYSGKTHIDNELRWVTKCIKNCRDSSKFKVCSSFQGHRNLTLMSFEVGNISYTHRYPQY